jgi:L,D-transpeptidase catalytic domain
VLGNFAIPHAHDIDGLEFNLAARRRHPKEFSAVRPVIGFVRRHAVPIGKLPMNFGVKVGECGAQRSIQLSRACLVGRAVRLWGMVEKSSATSSSNTSKFPPPCTSSVLRRTIAFAAALELLLVIGTFVSSGCIRLTNEDIIDLYKRVKVGTRVVVLPSTSPMTVATAAVGSPQGPSTAKSSGLPSASDMPRKRHKPEDVTAKLQQVDVLVSQGQDIV